MTNRNEVPKVLTGLVVYFSGSWNYYWLAETAEGVAFLPTEPGPGKPFFNPIEGVRTMIETGTIVLSTEHNHLDASRERRDAKEHHMKVVTYHIRHRLRRLRGNQFYRDKNPRETSTFCGSPVTGYDVNWNSPAKPWKTHNSDKHPDGTPMVACSKCLAKR